MNSIIMCIGIKLHNWVINEYCDELESIRINYINILCNSNNVEETDNCLGNLGVVRIGIESKDSELNFGYLATVDVDNNDDDKYIY